MFPSKVSYDQFYASSLTLFNDVKAILLVAMYVDTIIIVFDKQITSFDRKSVKNTITCLAC